MKLVDEIVHLFERDFHASPEQHDEEEYTFKIDINHKFKDGKSYNQWKIKFAQPMGFIVLYTCWMTKWVIVRLRFALEGQWAVSNLEFNIPNGHADVQDYTSQSQDGFEVTYDFDPKKPFVFIITKNGNNPYHYSFRNDAEV